MSYTGITNLPDVKIEAELFNLEEMSWIVPQYYRKEVNSAGAYLVNLTYAKAQEHVTNAKELEHAIDVVSNYRSARAFPLNTIQTFLRNHANELNKKNITAQRLKRLSSILAKLERFKNMELWDMQDIGGCRAVVRNLGEVKKLVDDFKSSSIRHKLAHEDDYIQEPRDSGYRSSHLIYRYISDRNEMYNGLKVEIQIRTPLQHAWATTVETVDAFTKQALKSSRGKPEWERFFQLMGTEMAFREGTPPVPGTPTDRRELRQELRECTEELQVLSSLAGFTTALRITKYASAKNKDVDYFMLSLDNVAEHLSVTGFSRRELKKASIAYSKKEKQIRDKKGTDAVLVSVDSMRNLQRAYPNYFADTHRFVIELKSALK